MTYEVVENFAAGLDRRKNPIVAPGGTLAILKNAMINPGGEIVKRRAFVNVATVPATSFGLAATESSLFVFGRNVDVALPAWSVPGVKLKSGKVPLTNTSLTQKDFDIFDGQVYIACTTTDTTTSATANPHYYFGPRDPNDTDGPYDGVLTEGRGKGQYIRTFQTKMYSIKGKYLYFSAVGNPAVWNAESYNERVDVRQFGNTNPIKTFVATGDISKFVVGRMVYIEGATTSGLTGANGFRTIATITNPDATGGVAAGSASFQLQGVNGSTATAPQKTGDMYATPCIKILSISNTNPAVVTVASADITKFVDGQKVKINGITGGIVPVPPSVTSNANVFVIDQVGNPANTFILKGLNAAGFANPQTADTWCIVFTDVIRTGQGYINLSTTDAASESLRSLEVYYDKLAVFSTQATQIWAVDPDPDLNQFEQLLRGTGTRAPRSPLQYGSGDVLFLDQTGIRSLKAKDSSNSASVSDVGSPVDPTIRELLLSLGQTDLDKAISLLEPSIGRFWMCIPSDTVPNQIFCLSYFPGPQITAWSILEVPFTIQYAVNCGGKLFFRDDANHIWVYGGPTGNTYDNCGVEVRLPYLSGKKPGHNKTYEAVDLTITGTWEVKVSYDFNQPEVEEDVGTFTSSTWFNGKMELQGYASHISLRLYNNVTGDARLSNIGVHYKIADDEQ